MSYSYEYTYPKNREAAGYSGPVPILIDTDTYVPGLMEVNDHRNLIRASIQRILGTTKGERVMQPEFGHNLKRMLFEPLDEIIIEDLRNEISNIINPHFQKWLRENDLLGSNMMEIYRDFNTCIINKLQYYK